MLLFLFPYYIFDVIIKLSFGSLSPGINNGSKMIINLFIFS